MGKIEKRHLLPSLLRYFDKTFIEMFLKQCSICHMILGLLLILLIMTETKMKKKQKKNKQNKKKTLKNHLLRNHMLYEAETL